MNVVGKFIRVRSAYSIYDCKFGIIYKEPIQKCYTIKFLSNNVVKCFNEQEIEMLDDSLMPFVNNTFLCYWCNTLTKLKDIKFNKNKKVIRYCPNCLR